MKRSPARLATTSATLIAAALGLTACSFGASEPRQLDQPPVVAPSAASVLADPAEPPSQGVAVPPARGSGSATAATSGAGRASSGCAEQRRWTTGPDEGGFVMSTAAFYLARAGRHECYDRVVFDVNGPAATGFSARYVPIVTADGSGHAVPVAGQAALEVVLRAPVVDDAGHQPGRGTLSVGDALVPSRTLTGWSSLAGVTYAGSFEGQTTIAVGVHEKRPFRVWTMSRQGYRQIVVDIAH